MMSNHLGNVQVGKTSQSFSGGIFGYESQQEYLLFYLANALEVALYFLWAVRVPRMHAMR